MNDSGLQLIIEEMRRIFLRISEAAFSDLSQGVCPSVASFPLPDN
jgi:hypothetical protein